METSNLGAALGCSCWICSAVISPGILSLCCSYQCCGNNINEWTALVRLILSVAGCLGDQIWLLNSFGCSSKLFTHPGLIQVTLRSELQAELLDVNKRFWPSAAPPARRVGPFAALQASAQENLTSLFLDLQLKLRCAFNSDCRLSEVRVWTALNL